MSLFFFAYTFLLFLDSTYKWCHTVFVFLWPTSLRIKFSRPIHISANERMLLLLWLCNIPLDIHAISLSICQFMDIWIAFISWSFSIVLLWILRFMQLFELMFLFFTRCVPRRIIDESYGSSIFSFLRHFHPISHSSCNNFKSYQHCTRVHFSPHPKICYL